MYNIYLSFLCKTRQENSSPAHFIIKGGTQQKTWRPFCYTKRCEYFANINVKVRWYKKNANIYLQSILLQNFFF